MHGPCYVLTMDLVRRCRLTLSNPSSNRPYIRALKLKYDKLLSNVAFKFNLRRYNLVRWVASSMEVHSKLKLEDVSTATWLDLKRPGLTLASSLRRSI
jgi:hypothetical protein